MEIELKTQLNKILYYINENYEEQAIIRPDISEYPYNIYISAKKYDLEISIKIPKEDHYLYGKCNYVLYFDYKANKKYRNELNWHGGGSSEKYNEIDYSNIAEFLDEYCTRSKNKQMTIFDYLDKEVK